MNRIRELREEKGMSLSALAKELNMTASAIGNYERGEREPKIETWGKLAKFFNVPTAYLMGISDEKESTIKTRDELEKIYNNKKEIKEKINSELEEINTKFSDKINLHFFNRELKEQEKKTEEIHKNSQNIINELKRTIQYIDAPGNELVVEITDPITKYISLINEMLSNYDYEFISQLLDIIISISKIYKQSTTEKTQQSKNTAIEKHLENINEITNILNKWYMNEIDKIKYNQKESNILE